MENFLPQFSIHEGSRSVNGFYGTPKITVKQWAGNPHTGWLFLFREISPLLENHYSLPLRSVSEFSFHINTSLFYKSIHINMKRGGSVTENIMWKKEWTPKKIGKRLGGNTKVVV
jgi:hypothetical protein